MAYENAQYDEFIRAIANSTDIDSYYKSLSKTIIES
jgi:hypothetical protein